MFNIFQMVFAGYIYIFQMVFAGYIYISDGIFAGNIYIYISDGIAEYIYIYFRWYLPDIKPPPLKKEQKTKV